MMRLTGHTALREEAQELVWDAMGAVFDDEKMAAQLCHKALKIYPDCIDALTILAEIESVTTRDYVDRMRKVVKAGRRDLGPDFFKKNRGCFWSMTETRPFMLALATLSCSLIKWGIPEAIDEAIEIQEEMLVLNPNDNQGIRDWLAGCYLARKRYNDTEMLFEQYPDEYLAAPAWARVLLAYATGDEKQASKLLAEARESNTHVEKYLTGRKRRPQTRADMYSPGDDSEAVFCADMLWEAWKKHPKAKKWLKEATDSGKQLTGHVRAVDRKSAGASSACLQTPDAAAAKGSKTSGTAPIIESLLSNINSIHSDAEIDENLYCDQHEMIEEVPEAYTPRFTDLVGLMDIFCDAHLNNEYKELCREMALSLCQTGSPVLRGKSESWAAGIVYALGRINFLSDPSQTPHMQSKLVAEGFGVSVATMRAKAKIINEGLDLMPLDPAWTLPGRMDDNPMVWMLEMDGFIIDVRLATREVQAAAYNEGLIPYIPADRDG